MNLRDSLNQYYFDMTVSGLRGWDAPAVGSFPTTA